MIRFEAVIKRLGGWKLAWLLVFALCYGSLSALARDDVSEIFPDIKVAELAQAAAQGNVKDIDRLIAEGVDINTQGKEGVTPLVFALAQKNLKGFTRLLHHGADPNLIYNGRDSIMWDLVEEKDIRYLERAIEYGGDVDALSGNRSVIFDAITLGRIEHVKILIDAGADVNFQNRVSGETPLHATGYSRKYEIAYMLLEAGADPRINDKNGQNGLLGAIEKTQRPGSDEIYQWRQKVIEYLRAAGMEINPKYP